MAEQQNAAEQSSVIIVNKLAQTLTVTVDSGNGVQSIVLHGGQSSLPLPATSPTPHTRNLAQAGHIRIRNA